MDSHDLHSVDRHALDLRHDGGFMDYYNMISVYVDGDRYASAALHCMTFLSNPPTHFDNRGYAEWKATCHMALLMLCQLLRRANTSQELVQFMSNYDINLAVRQKISAIRVWQLDAHILAFLSRANICVNWRIISAVRQVLFAADEEPPSKRRKITRHLTLKCKECCTDCI